MKRKNNPMGELVCFGGILLLSLFMSKAFLSEGLRDKAIRIAMLSSASSSPAILKEIDIKNGFWGKEPEKILVNYKPQELKAVDKFKEKETKRAKKDIPREFRGDIIEESFSPVAVGGKSPLIFGNAVINNLTDMSNEDVLSVLKRPWGEKLGLKDGQDEPVVLIYHTHATESFEEFDSEIYDKRGTWRSRDNSKNITSVGDEICKELDRAGIPYIHDKTHHDYPSYNQSYDRSKETVETYLKKYPSIKIAIDVHRDAVCRGESIVKPVANIDGEKTAQLMICIGCDGKDNSVPSWESNLRLGAELQKRLSAEYETLARPLLLLYRKYNQDLTNGSMLVEIGSHGNTLEEAKKSGRLFGRCLAQMLLDFEE